MRKLRVMGHEIQTTGFVPYNFIDGGWDTVSIFVVSPVALTEDQLKRVWRYWRTGTEIEKVTRVVLGRHKLLEISYFDAAYTPDGKWVERQELLDDEPVAMVFGESQTIHF